MSDSSTSPLEEKQQESPKTATTPQVQSTPRSSRIQRRTTDIYNANPEKDEKEEMEDDAKHHPAGAQFKAMFYRRWIGVKRSIGSVIANIIVTLVVSCLAIVVKALMNTLVSDKFEYFNFTAYPFKGNILPVIASDYANNFTKKPFQSKYVEVIKELYKQDTGTDADIRFYDNIESANKFISDCRSKGIFVSMGIGLPEEYNPQGGNNLTMIWNDTVAMSTQSWVADNMSLISYVNLYRIEYAVLTTPPNLSSFPEPFKSIITQKYAAYGLSKHCNLNIIYSLLAGQGRDIIFSVVAPLLIAAGLTSIITTVIVTPIIDIQGPIRAYMVSCNLEILPYWVVTFLFDFINWTIEVTLVWVLFVICRVENFSKNLGQTYYILWICGPAMILYIYSLSFLFNDADSASRNAFICNIILLIIPIIVTLVTLDFNDPLGSLNKTHWTGWIYGLFPPLLIEGYMQQVFITYTYNHDGLKYYFKSESAAQPYSIYAFVDIVIYICILIFIERWRIHLQRKAAKSNFGDYHEFFEEQKKKHPVTQEAHDMEKEVDENTDYAVRIYNVSRLFFNTEGKPIPAVNKVSLGVKKGSLFGFLGANGAGKTTLINMITSLLPPSDGTIEINGKDIMVENDPSLLAVCPQFNTHLCMDMTISEHFHFYSLLHRMSPEHEKRNSERLIQLLDLKDIKDIPIRELSEGDVRKLAIALSFLGRAQIILLDEPTATLDPVSRRQVHEMVLYYRGQKTFMLCTHLLSEAEALCDNISIMIKGNVYTVGSPQYLQSKFGTDFKVDMQLEDEQEETGEKVDKFFQENIPQAAISIKRPSARIYNVPAISINLGVLFKKMEEGKKGDNGFKYYTCSSSSLEKVFMEIVRISEGEEGTLM
ncbi:ABC transporter family protein [Trichomonas vaginalis G3]|uniref:ABC transporter family protein n=1 Tax=Trichomonas vaginalis (strain ATCC PRA-98 / G3) TaxID=412133 RepID=A2DY76_TRIV3|nr:ATPase activity, coupled to transmembrane movement of substances [Trichomonas vaginalis G3]EAY14685.1 ABC transporter family protein [Trichomonas vaginalis G3]KAI5505447.1 ATPase activity, coupled to transmembrane movement of substances [Trichomonas vaginalis G3]|eukprot:XP_001326908.1 ABC transporter family protein [Trichomonas vaginalis G3]